MFETKSTQCRWSKCELGSKAYHTPIQWDQHKEYAKVFVPQFPQQNYYYVQGDPPFQYRGGPSPMPQPQPGMSARTVSRWQGVAIGAVIMSSVIIVFTALSIWLKG